MKQIKKYGYILVSALCTLVAIYIIFNLQEVTPLGKNSLLTVDFFHQYGPMLGELWDRINNGSTLLYSFSMGLGLPIFRNFFNYLSSPFNIILFLFNRHDLLTSYSIIIALKVVASSITISILLSKKLSNKYYAIPLSILYAFSAYFCAYYWNIMWLDGIVMIPLITLGIEKIIDNNKSLLYILSLAIMIFANYFIGYMLCIFSCLYFIIYLILKTDKFEIKPLTKKCLTFVLSSLFAGSLCAFFLIPLFDGLHSISATKDAIPLTQYYSFTFKEYIFNHLSGVGSTVFKSDITNAPNISVGIIPFMLVCFFIANTKINIKTKVCYISLLMFLFISFFFAPLDFIWHAFHVPNDLPYRYSFIYSFIIILISAISLNKIKDLKKWIGTIIYIFIMLFIYLSKELNYLNITREMITMNYILASICYIVFILSKCKHLKYPLLVIVTLSCLFEVTYTFNNNWDIDQDMTSFYSDYDKTKTTLEEVKNMDNSFYRIEREDMLTFNDPSWYNYNGMIAFSSMEYESNALLLYNLGAPSNEINSFYYKYNTPIYNTLFSLNYIIGSTNLSTYEKTNINDVYKNTYKGSLMYGVNERIKEYELYYSPFINQNYLIESMTSISEVLKPIDIQKQETIYEDDTHTLIKYYIKNNYDNIYIYENDYDIGLILIENKLYYKSDDYDYIFDYTDEKILDYENYNESYIISNKYKNDIIEIYVGYNYYDEEYADKGFEIYELNYEKWDNAYKILENNSINILSFNENNISAYTDFDEAKSIYTSIPYDKGWIVYIDDKKTESYPIANALLGFDVKPGKHKISIKYEIPYFKLGITISIISAITIAILTKNQK